MDIYLARQPIFDRKKRLFAYEILYRGDLKNVFPRSVDGEVATSTVLAHSLFNVGLSTITGDKKALINFTEKHLLEKTPTQVPSSICVVEILEDVPASEKVLVACNELKQAGYTLALDDYTFEKSLDPFLELVSILKIDFHAVSMARIKKQLPLISNKHNIKFLAEKVENNEEYKESLEMGFDYFQGYFFSKPEILKNKKLDVAQVSLLSLIREVNRDDFSFSRVEKMITADVALSYKLLRYINSAFYSLVSNVKSIKHALTYLGEKGARQFISLAVASELAGGKTPELTKTAIVRAELCKLLSLKTNSKQDESQLFLLGLFSLLDAMLDMSMSYLLERLPLAGEFKEALIDKKGPLAPYIMAVKSYERGDLDHCSIYLSELGLEPEEMVSLYSKSLKWADLFYDK